MRCPRGIARLRYLAARSAALATILCGQAVCADLPPDPFSALTPIAADTADIRLGTTALVIAHALDPSVNAEHYSGRLDTLAAEAKPAVAAAPDSKAKLEAMAEFIYKRWGFADGKTLPADVFVSFTDVIDKRQWNCFGLSVLYVALGERVGLPLQMVSGRGHAFVHCSGTPYYVETTDHGRVHEGVDYLAGYLPFPCLDPGEYTPVSAREAVAVLLTQTGGALLAEGNPTLALLCFQHALQFDADHAEAHAALGFFYTQVGPNDRAIEAIQSAIEADPKLREAYGGLGAALRANGDLAGAVEALRKAVALCDKQPEPLFNLGQVLYDSGDLNGSIDSFRKYTALAPCDPDGFMRLAFPLEDAGKLDDALAAYRESLRLNPQNPNALVNSGFILEKQGRWDVSRSYFQKALELAPRSALAYAGLGRVLTETSQFSDAEKAFARSLELDAANPATWIDSARLEKKRGNGIEAIRKLDHALKLDPTDAETHFELADILNARGDAAKAKEHLRAAQSFGAEPPAALRSLITDDESITRDAR